MSEEEKQDSPDTVGNEKISEEDFERARYAYETNQSTLVDLADQLGVSRQGLSKRFKKHGVVKGSRAKEAEQAEKKESGYSANRAQWIEETRVNGYQALKQAQLIARKAMVDAAKNNRPLESIDPDLKAIQRYNKTLVDNIAATLNLLDADQHIDEDDLPQLIVEDLTDQEILDHHKATGALPEDASLEDLNNEEIITEDELNAGGV